jgi:nucleoside-diphosphate-sugar epimerase
MKKNVHDNHIAVIGSGGYIGKHFCKFLEQTNVNFSKIGRNSVLFNKDGISKPWTCLDDLESYYELESEKTIFINLAGYFMSDHRQDPRNFPKLINDNFIINCLFAELNRRLKKSHLVNIGTTWEKSVTGENIPRNIYALLKSYGSHFTQYMASTFGASAANIKLNDTYGGSDTRNKLLPYIKESVMLGNKIKVKSLKQKLNLTYIHDVVAAIYYAGVERLNGEYYVLSDEDIEVAQLIALVERSVGRKINFEDNEEPHSNVDWSIFKKIPNWKCRYSIENGIKEYFYGV